MKQKPRKKKEYYIHQIVRENEQVNNQNNDLSNVNISIYSGKKMLLIMLKMLVII